MSARQASPDSAVSGFGAPPGGGDDAVVHTRQRSPALRLYQASILRALLAGVRQPGVTLTVMLPRQSGKNEIAASLVAATLLGHARDGGSVVVCAPSLHPQAAISLERTRRALARLERLMPGARVTVRENSISAGRANAVFLSASPEANVAGHTASLLLVADEAQDIDSGWFDRQFRPMAASTGAPTVLFGTAWDGQTLLEREVARNRAADNAGGEPRRHFEVGWREVAKSIPAYGAYVRAERERLGVSHPLFLTQYELVPARGAGSFLDNRQIDALRGSHVALRGAAGGERYAAGLDFGGEGPGADATVLTIARVGDGRAEVVALRSWRSTSFGVLLAEVAETLRAWRVERVCADATGMGGPLCSSLGQVLGPRLEPVTFTAATKSELGFALLAAANTGRLSIHVDDGSLDFATCMAELRSCRSSLREGGLLRWFAPPGAHDDYVASLALCVRAAGSVRAPRIAVGRRR